MQMFLIMPQDVIVEGKILDLYDFDSKIELTNAQVDLFYKNRLPDGKQRRAGTLELEDAPPTTQEQLARSEYQWAKSEIESITEQLEKHADNSSRAIATEQEWRDYREALREYATVDEDGVYSLRTDKPARPS